MNTNSCSRVREKNEALFPVILQYLRNSEGKLETITRRNSLLHRMTEPFRLNIETTERIEQHKMLIYRIYIQA